MVEGVLAVDREQHLLTVNNAAFVLLGMQRTELQGKYLPEVVRCPALHKLVDTALRQEAPVEGEIVLHDENRERVVQVHGTALHDATGARTGAALVLNDITHLRRLEGVRREFVANVSHELRTPITSLKASVETLLDGAVQDKDNADRFLQIILRHADRMNAIINDLLLLAQMDQAERNGGTQAPLDWKAVPAQDLVQAALRTCAVKAEKKGIPITHDCQAGLSVRCDPHLVEQALINLLDNAINYSDAGKAVKVTARTDGADALIAVQDQGCGIPSNHVTRIFERFYRVDKARSREQGGTGLGLAIVKHIVQVHGGTVTVESEVGKGSTFTVRLPAVQGNGKG
jgi:two-component system phosphate regulon sensor histidine kinase PhoR